jgi:hypothetical protein
MMVQDTVTVHPCLASTSHPGGESFTERGKRVGTRGSNASLRPSASGWEEAEGVERGSSVLMTPQISPLGRRAHPSPRSPLQISRP